RREPPRRVAGTTDAGGPRTGRAALDQAVPRASSSDRGRARRAAADLEAVPEDRFVATAAPGGRGRPERCPRGRIERATAAACGRPRTSKLSRRPDRGPAAAPGGRPRARGCPEGQIQDRPPRPAELAARGPTS